MPSGQKFPRLGVNTVLLGVYFLFPPTIHKFDFGRVRCAVNDPMVAQAGPSNPPKARRVKPSAKKSSNPGKSTKISEKQRITELEKAAVDFVSFEIIFISAYIDQLQPMSGSTRWLKNIQ